MRFSSPPWFALEAAEHAGDIISIAPGLNRRILKRKALSAMAMEPMPLKPGDMLKRVEFDEDGNVWLAKDTGA